MWFGDFLKVLIQMLSSVQCHSMLKQYVLRRVLIIWKITLTVSWSTRGDMNVVHNGEPSRERREIWQVARCTDLQRSYTCPMRIHVTWCSGLKFFCIDRFGSCLATKIFIGNLPAMGRKVGQWWTEVMQLPTLIVPCTPITVIILLLFVSASIQLHL